MRSKETRSFVCPDSVLLQKSTKGTSWLQQWARDENERQNPKKNRVSQEKSSAPEVPKVPMEVVNHLQQLYFRPVPSSEPGTQPAEQQLEYKEFLENKRKKDVKKITEDLSNIEFDDV